MKVVDIVVANLSIQLKERQGAGFRDSIVREQTPEGFQVHDTLEEAIGVQVADDSMNVTHEHVPIRRPSRLITAFVCSVGQKLRVAAISKHLVQEQQNICMYIARVDA